MNSSTVRYSWRFELDRTGHLVEFVDGAFGVKTVALDGEELVNLRSTLVSSFTHRFEIAGREFWIKKEDGDYDLFYDGQPNAGLRVLAQQTPRTIGKAFNNPFEEPVQPKKESIWPTTDPQPKKVQTGWTNPFADPPTDVQRNPFGSNPFSSPAQTPTKPPSNVDLLELDVKKPVVRSDRFQNPFEQAAKVPPPVRQTIPTPTQPVPTQPASADIDFMSMPAKNLQPKTIDLQTLGFEDLTPKSTPQAPVPTSQPSVSPGFTNETFDSFGGPSQTQNADAFADFTTKSEPFKPVWSGFKDLKDPTTAPIQMETRRKMQIFDNPPAAPPKPSNPFATYDSQQRGAKPTSQAPTIFDQAGEAFKDAVLVPKGNHSFETRLGSQPTIPLEDYVAGGGRDAFDIELERNKRDNENTKLGRYDIDPEEKVGELIEGVQGFIERTSKFLGKVEWVYQEENEVNRPKTGGGTGDGGPVAGGESGGTHRHLF